MKKIIHNLLSQDNTWEMKKRRKNMYILEIEFCVCVFFLFA